MKTNVPLVFAALLASSAAVPAARAEEGKAPDAAVPAARSEEGGKPGAPEAASAPEKSTAPAARKHLDFAFDLFRAVAAAGPGKNVFLSPSSARWALGMAYAGASGETASAMAAALGALPAAENLAAEEKRLEYLLSADPKVQLRVANSLWLKLGFPFRQDTLASIKTAYRADVFERDFTRADADEANDWVSKKTSGKIKNIIGKFEDADRALLINAVYFKAPWTEKFKRKNTKKEDFLTASGKAVKRPLMRQHGRFTYFGDDEFQAVFLPYARGRFGMFVLLPAKTVPLSRLTGQLPAYWKKMMDGIEGRPGEVYLPRFKMEFDALLNEPLTKLGMGVAFDRGKADFTGLAAAPAPEDRLCINQVLQKTFVEVNEEGTEAAAATTGVMAVRGNAIRGEPFVFRADRPFLFAIAETRTMELLFLGALYDPK